MTIATSEQKQDIRVATNPKLLLASSAVCDGRASGLACHGLEVVDAAARSAWRARVGIRIHSANSAQVVAARTGAASLLVRAGRAADAWCVAVEVVICGAGRAQRAHRVGAGSGVGGDLGASRAAGDGLALTGIGEGAVGACGAHTVGAGGGRSGLHSARTAGRDRLAAGILARIRLEVANGAGLAHTIRGCRRIHHLQNMNREDMRKSC